MTDGRVGFGGNLGVKHVTRRSLMRQLWDFLKRHLT